MQGFFAFRSAIAADGRFFAPAGDARVSIVDVRDIAAVAAKALTEDGYGDKIFDVTGPDALTHAEMAAELSAVVGKPVVYIDVPDGTMRAALLDFGLPEWQVDGLIEDYAHYRRDEASAVSTAVADVTGRAPRSFAAFAREYATLFSS
jgi:uncharacterized protein YbjT (DUF2867 family)